MLGVYFSVSLDFVFIIVLVWHFLPSVPVFFYSVVNKLTGVSSFFIRLEISKNTKTINWPNLVSSQVQGRIVATEHARTLTNFPLVFISYSLYLWERKGGKKPLPWKPHGSDWRLFGPLSSHPSGHLLDTSFFWTGKKKLDFKKTKKLNFYSSLMSTTMVVMSWIEYIVLN